jgi:cell division protein FtsZ
MAIGRGSGDQRAIDAANQAVASPLLDVSMEGARGVLFNITGSGDLTLAEINDAAEIINRAADPDANIIFGTVTDPSMGNEVKITLIATGFDQSEPGYGGGRRDFGGGPRVPRGPRYPVDDPPPLRERPQRSAGFGDDPSPFDDDESEIDIPPFLRPQRRRGQR